ncbi:Hypothetical predicted protein [Marmota monax]|uniref:Uncharacterized protein n=1 Tax=Marmota monax TaxID=9995 RepID=A0A5E4DIW5_MARMO|nr:Hypothetical predicted protein [Marmota monax]
MPKTAEMETGQVGFRHTTTRDRSQLRPPCREEDFTTGLDHGRAWEVGTRSRTDAAHVLLEYSLQPTADQDHTHPGKGQSKNGLSSQDSRTEACSRPGGAEGTPTDTVVSAPSGWKLQETDVNPPVTLVDLNLHGSFPCVPFATKISLGVYTSKADTPAVPGEKESTGVRLGVTTTRTLTR